MKVKDVLSSIWGGIKKLFNSIVNFVKKVLNRVLIFLHDVVDFFKKLNLNPERDTPFIIDAGILGDQIKNAPKVDVGLFKGVYCEDTNTITHYEVMDASKKGVDSQTEEIMQQSEEGIVVLQ